MLPKEITPKPEIYSRRPVVMGKGGMVVAGTPLAAQAGARVLVWSAKTPFRLLKTPAKGLNLEPQGGFPPGVRESHH